jgi:hypothetical protein
MSIVILNEFSGPDVDALANKVKLRYKHPLFEGSCEAWTRDLFNTVGNPTDIQH